MCCPSVVQCSASLGITCPGGFAINTNLGCVQGVSCNATTCCSAVTAYCGPSGANVQCPSNTQLQPNAQCTGSGCVPTNTVCCAPTVQCPSTLTCSAGFAVNTASTCAQGVNCNSATCCTTQVTVACSSTGFTCTQTGYGLSSSKICTGSGCTPTYCCVPATCGAANGVTPITCGTGSALVTTKACTYGTNCDSTNCCGSLAVRTYSVSVTSEKVGNKYRLKALVYLADGSGNLFTASDSTVYGTFTGTGLSQAVSASTVGTGTKSYVYLYSSALWSSTSKIPTNINFCVTNIIPTNTAYTYQPGTKECLVSAVTPKKGSTPPRG